MFSGKEGTYTIVIHKDTKAAHYNSVIKSMDDINLDNVILRLDGCRTHLTFFLLKLINDSGFH